MESHKWSFNYFRFSEKLVPYLNKVDEQSQALLDEMMPKHIDKYDISLVLKHAE